MQIQHLRVQDGLSQGSPYHMLRDSRGFLWLGTQDGVNRFDGHRFRVYKPDARNPYALKGVNVAGIVEDSTGNIWVGTEEGLNRYERSTDRFSLVLTSDRKRRVSPFHAKGNELWLTSEGQGILVYNLRTRKLRRLGNYAFINRDFDFVDWTTCTPFGDVWLQNSTGLVRFDIAQQKYHYYFANTTQNEYGEPLHVYSYTIDQDNIAWLGTDQGLVRFDHQRKRHTLFGWTSEERALGVVFSLDEDHNGQLWLGTQRNGLWIFDKDKKTFREVQYRTSASGGFDNYEFYRVYVDDAGIIWANSDPDGLVKIVPNASMFGYFGQPDPNRPSRNLSDMSIRSLAEDRHGNIWLGTEGGLDVFDPKRRKIVARYLTSGDNILKYLFQDSQKRMWVGTYGGIMRFNEKRGDFTTFSYRADPGTRLYTRNILELPDHKLLLGTQQGMWLFDPATEEFTRVPQLRDHNIFSTFLDHRGVLWLGSYFDRLYAYTITDGVWKKQGEALEGFNINTIEEDTLQKVLWIATEKGLVAYHRDTRKFRIYDENDGLVNSYIYGIVTGENGEVYASTNHGVTNVNVKTGRVRNFDPSDGLQGYEFNGNAYLKTSTGECYFGGVKGLNYFYPRQFQKLSYNSRIHFFNFMVNDEAFAPNRNVDDTELLYLAHDENTFSLEFAAVDYYSNGKNYYRYQLDGQDEEWVEAGDRNYVRYANLTPGKYVLRVKSANRDGVWNEQERQMVIRVKAPFWQTWWFTLIYVALIGWLLFALTQRRLGLVGKQQRERLKIALDAQEQERKSIAQDLHDEVGSRLATLKLYVSSLTNFLKDSPEARRLKQEVLDIIHISLVDIRRLLRELSPRTLEQYGYTAAVEELVNKINASDLVHVTFEARKLGGGLPKNIETGLYRITQELLNNSLKHANASEIVISLVPSGNTLSFFYSDNGQGFLPEKAQKGLGVNNVESRVTVLGGKINWYSAPGNGLEVTIEIPT